MTTKVVFFCVFQDLKIFVHVADTGIFWYHIICEACIARVWKESEDIVPEIVLLCLFGIVSIVFVVIRKNTQSKQLNVSDIEDGTLTHAEVVRIESENGTQKVIVKYTDDTRNERTSVLSDTIGETKTGDKYIVFYHPGAYDTVTLARDQKKSITHPKS